MESTIKSVILFTSSNLITFLNHVFGCNQQNSVTRNSYSKLFQLGRTNALSQKCLSYLGPFIWNGLPDDVKMSNNVNTFKHKVKKSFLRLLWEKDQHMSMYTVGTKISMYTMYYYFSSLEIRNVNFILKWPQWK